MKIRNPGEYSIADIKSYLPEIDGLRGIAILMVLAVHSSQFVGNDHTGSFVFQYLENLVNSGARGVQLFFMVSAFTLFSSSYTRFKVDRFPKTYFYIRRAFRILPYWWFIIILLGIYKGLEINHLVPSLLFYFGFIRFDSVYDVNPQGWSLFVEECFYILLPLIFSYISNLRRSVIFVVICFFIRYVWVRYAHAKLGIPDENNFVTLFPLASWYCFAIGIFIYFYREELLRLLHKLQGKSVYLIDAITVLMFATMIHRDYFYSTLALTVLFFAALDKRTLIGRFACNPLLMRFGGCCYSIYLFHILLLSSLHPAVMASFDSLGLAKASVDVKFLIYFPVISFIALGLGVISFKLIEKPCVELGKFVIKKIDTYVLSKSISVVSRGAT